MIKNYTIIIENSPTHSFNSNIIPYVITRTSSKPNIHSYQSQIPPVSCRNYWYKENSIPTFIKTLLILAFTQNSLMKLRLFSFTYFRRHLLQLLLVITVIYLIHVQFNRPSKIVVDRIVKPTTRPPKFTAKNFESWPFLIPANQKRFKLSGVISNLYKKSGTIKLGLIMPIFITKDYVIVFFNWIANVLLHDSPHLLQYLLVIPMDNGSCEIIQHFDIEYVCLNIPEFLNHLGTFGEITDNSSMNSLFSTRLIVLWLLSSWGFDILHFDVDAVPVRPKFSDLFLRGDEADIVAGIGHFPSSVDKTLGGTICMGTIYMKSLLTSKGVLKLFTEMGKVSTFDDQLKINRAILNMGLYWESKKQGETWIGVDSSRVLRINFLSHTLVCRKTCFEESNNRGTPNDELYMMHPLSSKSGSRKENILEVLHLWTLKTHSIPELLTFNIDLVDFVKTLYQL